MIMNSEERRARLYVLFKHSWWHQLITTSVAPMMEDLNYECQSTRLGLSAVCLIGIALSVLVLCADM